MEDFDEYERHFTTRDANQDIQLRWAMGTVNATNAYGGDKRWDDLALRLQRLLSGTDGEPD